MEDKHPLPIVLVPLRVSMILVIHGMITDDESHHNPNNITDDDDIITKQAFFNIFYKKFQFVF